MAKCTRFSKRLSDEEVKKISENFFPDAHTLYQAFTMAIEKTHPEASISISNDAKMVYNCEINIANFMKKDTKVVIPLDMEQSKQIDSLLDRTLKLAGELNNISETIKRLNEKIDDMSQSFVSRLDRIEVHSDLIENRIDKLENRMEKNLEGSPERQFAGSLSKLSFEGSNKGYDGPKSYSILEEPHLAQTEESGEFKPFFNPLSKNCLVFNFKTKYLGIERIARDYEWFCCFGLPAIPKMNKARFTVKIEKTKASYIMVGISSNANFNLSSCKDQVGSIFFYAYNGTIYKDGIIHTTNIFGCDDGNLITVEVDRDEGEVEFFVNGKLIFTEQYPLLQTKTIEFFPCVETFHVGDSLTFI